VNQDLLLPDVGYPQLEIPVGIKRSDRIKKMHGVFGKGPDGKLCKTCAHLIRTGYKSRTYIKCDLNKITKGEATDWRAGYDACGKYEESAQ
jgi:hypothetical protein